MINNFKNIQEIFKKVVCENKSRVAIKDGINQIRYGELDILSNKVADYLIKNIKGKNQEFIAVSMDKSYLYIVAILGILKSGNVFLPIDCKLPEQRKQYILEDAKVNFILTDTSMPFINGKKLCILDINLLVGEEDDETCFSVDNTSNDLAYIIYTSGTTGNPKGTLLEHKGILNLRNFWREEYQVSNLDKILSFSNISFDASIWEIFMALLTGAELHLVGKEIIDNFRFLENYIETEKISIVTLPPTYSAYLDIKKLKNLRILFSAGSSASLDFYKKIKEQTDVRFVNAYGPTEATICSTTWEGEEENGKSLPIGYPIKNVEVFILNDCFQETKNGEVGELVIAGENLARGYLNNSELTNKKFVYLSNLKKRVYRTGDLASKDRAGKLYFHGRIDNQVKLGGHRIELDEIKNVLEKIEYIYEAAIVTKENRILAFYTQNGEEKTEKDILYALKNFLPTYMIPNFLKRLSTIPLTVNGKPDQERLIEIYEECTANKIEDDNEPHSVVLDICRESLLNTNISANDNFYTLGGDSIKAIQLCAKLYDLGYELKPSDILINPIIKEFTKKLRRVVGGNILCNPEGVCTTTPIQRWFLNKNLKRPYQFNQSILFKGKNKFDKERMQACLVKIIDYHDVLRATFDFSNMKEFEIKKEQYRHAISKHYVNSINALYEVIENLQSSLNPEKGKLLEAAIIESNFGNFFFICIHHLVCDGISMRILLEDLIRLYCAEINLMDSRLAAKTISFRQWCIELEKYYMELDLSEDVEYWLKIQRLLGYEKKNLCDKELQTDIRKIETTIFEKKETEIFKNRVPHKYDASINEIMIAAFAYAYLKTVNGDKILFNLELHGRDICNLDLNTSRTVGWFTSEYPQLIMCDKLDGSVYEMIDNIKRQIREVPHKGQTYEMLKYYGGYNFGIETLDINFNYLGEIGFEKNPQFEVFYDKDRMSLGPMGYANVSSDDANYFNLNITPYIFENKLHFSCSYNPYFISQSFVKKIHKHFVDIFTEMVNSSLASGMTSEIEIKMELENQDLQEILSAIEKL